MIVVLLAAGCAMVTIMGIVAALVLGSLVW